MRGGQCIFSQGWINHVFFSRKYALVESENKWNVQDDFFYHCVLIDSRGDVVAHISRSSLLPVFGVERWDFSSRNPFRPGADGDLLFLLRSHQLGLVDAAGLPRDYRIPKSGLDEFLRDFGKIHIDLSFLMPSKDDEVLDFNWHPSGKYLAVDISRRVYLLHWDSGEVVASIGGDDGGSYWMREWSENGKILGLYETKARGKYVKCVWDITENSIRDERNTDLWQHAQSETRPGKKLVTPSQYWPDLARGKQMSGLKDKAPCPYDSSLLATIGGEGSERRVRIWERVEN
uniref:Uncharacterized protein n=1 Tax=Candidatus Kentrum sp. LPFa TaxID=2126335 RepID=A0A450XXN1_9GAMM|nr:MAG: hypothetical protein BECKLPF1236A_GA0070988_102302 [Candidatus Kentron sp. LPFa]VFK34051.1 MAG: hypothetical protein BECKLPF1236C_GA0070990_102412 [Candidatus Kentron sp. LPFa]